MTEENKAFTYALKQKILSGYNRFLYVINHKYIKRSLLLFTLLGLFVLGIKAYSWFHLYQGSTMAPESKPHIALIEIKGDIISNNTSELSIADRIILSIRKAAKNPHVSAIILRIDSRGGDGIQSAQIYREILRQRTQNPKMPIIAVCQAMCASAAYHIASACDQIYANPFSIVGSIGVQSSEFGFVDTLKKLGIERRVIAAHEDTKVLFDAFSPRTTDATQAIKNMISDMHEAFVEDVKIGRGNRLQDAKGIFSGRVWTGEQALPLGLIDGFASLSHVSRQILKVEEVVEYNINQKLIKKLSNLFFNFSVNNQTNIFKALARFFFKKL